MKALKTNEFNVVTRSFDKYLTRPNGKPLSEQDKLLLDWLIHITENKKIATTTYAYLLENKFCHKLSKRTVKRTLENISLYIEAKFYNKYEENGDVVLNRIVLTRLADFDKKMQKAVDEFKLNEERGQK